MHVIAANQRTTWGILSADHGHALGTLHEACETYRDLVEIRDNEISLL
jgi:hypothetical protein